MQIALFYAFAFASCWGAVHVRGAPVHSSSYIQDLNVSYQDGDSPRWHCGIQICPASAQGCRVRLKNDQGDHTQLRQEFACLDADKKEIMSGAVTTGIHPALRIDIDLESFVGAESVYSTGYGMGGHESAQGVVAPHDWDVLKKSAAQNKAAVDQNSQL